MSTNIEQLFICLLDISIPSFFLTSLLEYNCFTMVCQFLLYNKVNQLYVHIYAHIPSLLHLPPTLPIPPHQVVTNHRADLPVLCSCFPLAIYFTFGSIYMSLPLSHCILEEFEKVRCQLFSKCLIEFTCEAIWSWAFICWKIFNHSFNFSACDKSVHIFYFFLVQSRKVLHF